MKKTIKFIIVCLLLNLIFILTNLDLYLQSLFFNGEWYLDNHPFAVAMYKIAPFFSIVVAVTGLFMFIYYKFKKNNPIKKKIGAFLILSMLLGPGLVVNSLGKGFMGRPRPRNVIEFGGDEKFLPPLIIGRFIPDLFDENDWEKKYLGLHFVQGKHNSFPSGHASVIFYLIFPYFIFKKKLTYLLPGFILGWIMGGVRMVQGGHFFSDVYWAFIVVFGVNYLLAKVMNLDEVLDYVKKR